jgi:hypothetical protein
MHAMTLTIRGTYEDIIELAKNNYQFASRIDKGGIVISPDGRVLNRGVPRIPQVHFECRDWDLQSEMESVCAKFAQLLKQIHDKHKADSRQQILTVFYLEPRGNANDIELTPALVEALYRYHVQVFISVASGFSDTSSFTEVE